MMRASSWWVGLAAASLLHMSAPGAQPVPDAPETVSGMVEALTRGIRIGAEPAPEGPPAATTGTTAPSVAPVVTAPPAAPAVSITLTFATGSATLSPEAQGALAVLGQALASPDLAPYRFLVEGHTDTVGPAAANQALSERRAQAVRDFLQGRYGVPAGRLLAVGLGETHLRVPTPDEQDEPRNRRVQVVNLGR